MQPPGTVPLNKIPGCSPELVPPRPVGSMTLQFHVLFETMDAVKIFAGKARMPRNVCFYSIAVYCFTFTGSWFIMLFMAIDRFIAVWSPFKLVMLLFFLIFYISMTIMYVRHPWREFAITLYLFLPSNFIIYPFNLFIQKRASVASSVESGRTVWVRVRRIEWHPIAGR